MELLEPISAGGGVTERIKGQGGLLRYLMDGAQYFVFVTIVPSTYGSIVVCAATSHHTARTHARFHSSTQIIESKTPYDEKPLFLYTSHQSLHAPLGQPPDGEEYWALKVAGCQKHYG